MLIPQTHHEDFYSSRDFNVVGAPLVWTAPRSRLNTAAIEDACALDAPYIISLKLDGKFIRVIKKGKLLRMMTSGGLDFFHNKLAVVMMDYPDGQYNMEAVYKAGVLGELHSLGYITTAVTDYRHGRSNAGDWRGVGSEIRFVIHDYLCTLEETLESPTGYCMDTNFFGRRQKLKHICLDSFETGKLLTLVKSLSCVPSLRFIDVPHMLRYLKNDLGYDPTIHEGLVFHEANGKYQLPMSLRSYKVKNLRECTGVVIATERDVNQAHGTLIVEVDGIEHGQPGYECRVSSGVDNKIRGMPDEEVQSLRVEIDYEQLTADGEYTQPRIKRYYKDVK